MSNTNERRTDQKLRAQVEAVLIAVEHGLLNTIRAQTDPKVMRTALLALSRELPKLLKETRNA